MSFEFLISKIQKNNFLLIGRAGIDIYPDPPGTKTENAKSFVTHLGGSSANMGVQLTLFGGNCNLLTRVSDDALGKLAINQLNHYGVKNKLVEFEKNESRISFAIVETTVKDHQSIIYRHKASDLFLNKDDVENANIQNFDCLLITGTSLAAEPSRSATLYALDIANKNNIPVIMDIDYRPYTWESSKKAKEVYNLAASKCSGVIGNDDEFGVLAGDYNNGLDHARQLAKNVSLIIYKKGEKGSITFAMNKEIKKGIFPVKPLKPTGAGDAFNGSLAAALSRGETYLDSVIIGCATASISVTRYGTSEAMPSLEAVSYTHLTLPTKA